MDARKIKTCPICKSKVIIEPLNDYYRFVVCEPCGGIVVGGYESAKAKKLYQEMGIY